jgi:hypothetical protein
MPSFALEGPRCDRCGGPSGRAVRTRELTAQPDEKVYYLAYSWACDVCGHSWVDDGLERLNACAAEGARGMRHRDAYAAGRRAS